MVVGKTQSTARLAHSQRANENKKRVSASKERGKNQFSLFDKFRFGQLLNGFRRENLFAHRGSRNLRQTSRDLLFLDF